MAFRASGALYRGFVGGRGSGKSWIACYDLINRAKPGRLYSLVAPTYQMLADSEMRTFLDVGRQLGRIDPGGVRRSPPSVRLFRHDGRGAEVLFRSADDPDRLRGPNLSGCCLVEASLMHRDAYDIAIATLREAGEQGWLSASFTPRGLTHWTYDVFGRGRPDTELFHASTWENPFNPPEFYATLKQQYAPARALQELEGQFVDLEGAEFPSDWFGDHLWVPGFPGLLALRVIYLDPSVGKDAARGDYSAFVQLGRDRAGVLYVRADLARRPMTRTVADGLALARGFAPLDAFAVEANAFQQLMADEFERQSKAAGVMLPLHTVSNYTNKADRIRRLTPYLSRGNVRFVESPGTRLLVEQLRSFPLGDHDDGPDAMTGAVTVAINVFNRRHARAGAT